VNPARPHTPSSNAAPSLLELSNVRFAYHAGQTVIGGVSLTVMPKRLVTLIGPNGSGKTTLMKLMLGLLSPSAGAVKVRGKSIERLSASQRAAWLSYVPQRAGVTFGFTVREVVAMGRFALPADDHAVAGAMALCELRDLSSRPFTELSTGQQQRVLLARAMVQSAGQGRVMLLDEPTSAMDLAYVHKSMRRLRELAEQGMAVIAVMQDLNLAARYADDVWLMREGKVVAHGPWSSVLTPNVLEPVYGVRMAKMERPSAEGGETRPVFDVDLAC